MKDCLHCCILVLQTFAKPFPPKLEFELLNEKVPCNVEFAFIVRVSLQHLS
jgi:hypothetical protein